MEIEAKLKSYADWIEAFENIKKYPLSADNYLALEGGTLDI